MAVADLPRWLWLAAAVAIGLAHGSVQEWSSYADPLDDYEVLLADQRQFELALVSERHGHRMFKDVTVYPHWIRSPSTGKRRLVHVVAGAYWDGRTETRDGAVTARFEPACFVAPLPYRPVNVAPAGGATPASQGPTPEEQYDSVLDYLAALRTTRGLEYRYAWWWWTRLPVLSSTVVSVALVAGVLPTVLNLLAFGRLTRPRREKHASFWHVRRPRPKAVPAPSLSPARSVPHGDRQEPGADAGLTTAPPTAPAAVLATTPVEPTTVAAADKHFGARQEDFYPTEVHVAPPHSS